MLSLLFASLYSFLLVIGGSCLRLWVGKGIVGSYYNIALSCIDVGSGSVGIVDICDIGIGSGSGDRCFGWTLKQATNIVY